MSRAPESAPGPATGVVEPLDTTTLSTQPAPIALPGLGWWELLRWCWRQLTSMRTALVLLFLLALASVPGSVFPQQATNPGDVSTYVAEHPALAPLLARLGMFDVFGSIWFSAIYLLLFVSLLGCVIPRSLMHVRAMRARPPAAPRNLSRMPEHRSYTTAASPETVIEAARAGLRTRRWRVASTGGPDFTVAAEKGYLRETGNLVFHIALILILAGIAIGELWGTSGSVIVVQGTAFANTMSRYDSFSAGPRADVNDLPPFSLVLTSFSATYQQGGPQNGAPRSFSAKVLVRDTPNSPERSTTINVNEPLVIDGTKVFLIGHGYAPHVTVRDGQGRVVLSQAVPFLPRDGMFTSQGVVKAPDAQPTQLGFEGFFLPTAEIDPQRGPISTFPAAELPALVLVAYKGDLGLDDGTAQSVYVLDTSKMKQAGAPKLLAVGQSMVLPDHLGSITFDGVEQFASFSIAHDPGRDPVFIAAMTALAGLMLSLFVRRRRIWVRATPTADGRTLVAVAGLARVEAGGLAGEVDAVLERIRQAAPGEPAAGPDGQTAQDKSELSDGTARPDRETP
jgi:cytochrome c biogenesis protein